VRWRSGAFLARVGLLEPLPSRHLDRTRSNCKRWCGLLRATRLRTAFPMAIPGEKLAPASVTSSGSSLAPPERPVRTTIFLLGPRLPSLCSACVRRVEGRLSPVSWWVCSHGHALRREHWRGFHFLSFVLAVSRFALAPHSLSAALLIFLCDHQRAVVRRGASCPGPLRSRSNPTFSTARTCSFLRVGCSSPLALFPTHL